MKAKHINTILLTATDKKIELIKKKFTHIKSETSMIEMYQICDFILDDCNREIRRRKRVWTRQNI